MILRIWRIRWWYSVFLINTARTFWVNLVQNIKIVSLWRIQWCVTFLSFRPEIPLLGKFVLNIQNCQFKLKLGFWSNSNMLNLIAVFTHSFLDQKHPFYSKFTRKFKIICLSWNLVPSLTRICKNQWRHSFFGQQILSKK